MISFVKFGKVMPGLVVKLTFGAPHYSSRQTTAATEVTVTGIITVVHLNLWYFIVCIHTHNHVDFVEGAGLTSQFSLSVICCLLLLLITYQLYRTSWRAIPRSFSENPTCSLTGQGDCFLQDYLCILVTDTSRGWVSRVFPTCTWNIGGDQKAVFWVLCCFWPRPPIIKSIISGVQTGIWLVKWDLI